MPDYDTRHKEGYDAPPLFTCPVCAEGIDYCQGHGGIGDPEGYRRLQEHDKGNHKDCAMLGCEQAAASAQARLATDMAHLCGACGHSLAYHLEEGLCEQCPLERGHQFTKPITDAEILQVAKDTIEHEGVEAAYGYGAGEEED